MSRSMSVDLLDPALVSGQSQHPPPASRKPDLALTLLCVSVSPLTPILLVIIDPWSRGGQWRLHDTNRDQ